MLQRLSDPAFLTAEQILSSTPFYHHYTELLSKWRNVRLICVEPTYIRTAAPRGARTRTFVVEEVLKGGPSPVVADEAAVADERVVEAALGATDALLPQVAHEELQADERKDTQAEDGEDHYVGQLLY